MELDTSTSNGGVYRSTVVSNKDKSHLTEIKISKKGRASSLFSSNTVKKRLPILSWIGSYNVQTFITDMVAGLTVGLLLIPQALAYGIMVGLTPSHGLYAAWTGCFVYFLFGSTKELNIGPTAILILMTAPYVARGGEAYSIILCFTSGIIELITAIFNLGFLINFISQPVINGFTTAAVVLGATAQLKPLFGLKLKTSGTFDTWVKVVTNLRDFKWQDLSLGLSCMAALTFIKLLPRLTKTPASSRGFLFYLSNGRNALVVIISSIIAAILESQDQQPFTLTGHVEAGIPKASIPPFSLNIGNQTLGFTEILADAGSGLIMIPFIAIVYNVGIISSFAKGKTVDGTQEILAVALSNILASFFGSMPITSCMSRTAVNCSSGAKTPMGGLMTGTMVLMALLFLTPYFRFIPKGTLAAVIICALLNMLDHHIVRNLWKSTKRELIPYVLTFWACFFFGLSTGILIGIAVNLSMLLLSVAKPKVTTSSVSSSKGEFRYIGVKISHGIHYPSSSHVRTAISKAGVKDALGVDPVVVDCSQIQALDYTAAKGLAALSSEYKQRVQPLVFLGLSPRVLGPVAGLLTDLTMCAEKEHLYDLLVNQPTKDENAPRLFIDVTKHSTPSTGNGDTSQPLLAQKAYPEIV